MCTNASSTTTPKLPVLIVSVVESTTQKERKGCDYSAPYVPPVQPGMNESKAAMICCRGRGANFDGYFTIRAVAMPIPTEFKPNELC